MNDELDIPETLVRDPDTKRWLGHPDDPGRGDVQMSSDGTSNDYDYALTDRVLNRFNACAGLGDTKLPEGWVTDVVNRFKYYAETSYRGLPPEVVRYFLNAIDFANPPKPVKAAHADGLVVEQMPDGTVWVTVNGQRVQVPGINANDKE